MKSEIEKVHCNQCNMAVGAKVLFTHDEDANNIYDEGFRHAYLECPACKGGILVSQMEHYDGEGDFYWSNPYTLYPKDTLLLNHNVPESVENAYSEALKCKSVNALNACIIMCRKTLEALCDDLGMSGKMEKLEKKLKSLVDKGFINTDIHNWSTLVRLKGNKGAHSLSNDITRKEIDDLMNFVKAIIEYIYVYKKKYNEFIQQQNIENK